MLLSTHPATASESDTLIYSWSSNVGELNPHLYSPNQMFAQAMAYESLVRYGEGGKILPWLAEKWDITPDGKTCTFTLRRGVVFSDGTPFTAGAVKRNFDAVLANADRHKWLELIAQIQKTEAVSETVFRLTLKNAYYPTLQELCLIRPLRFMSPAAMPDSGNTADGIKKPVGTGPWKLMETKKGEYDLFERNEAYWGEKPKVKKLLVKVISDPNTRAVAMQTGEIDLVHGAAGHGGGQLGLDAFARFAANSKFTTKVSQPLATRSLAINSKNDPTNDLAVRQAILQAVDKDALCQHIFLGIEKKADFLFSPDTPYCDLKLKPYAHDVQQANSLLDQSGWTQAAAGAVRLKDGRLLSIDLCFVGNDAQQKAIAEAVQGDLAKIGMKVNLIGEEADANNNRQKTGEFGMIFGDTWGAPYDPHSFVSSMRTPSHADYQAQIGLPMKADIDARIGEVLLATDTAKRHELYRFVLSTLHEQAVYLPLSYLTGVIVHGGNLSNVSYGPMNYQIPFEKIEKR
jgi:nickel transport system substrate-binding protein